MGKKMIDYMSRNSENCYASMPALNWKDLHSDVQDHFLGIKQLLKLSIF